MKSRLYAGTVMHHRFRPRKHRFTYSVVSMLIDLDEVQKLHSSLRLFSVDRFNLFSWHNKDHGDGSSTPLADQVRGRLAEQGLDRFGHRLELLCYPRMFGYVFNPLSVFYCYNDADELGVILYEVHNTFDERHTYLIELEPSSSDALIRQRSKKAFYVSPFMPMDAHYQFRMRPPQNRVAVCIRQSTSEGSLLHATFTGEKTALSDSALLKVLTRYPLMTFKVIAGIHWEALRLWKKGVPLQTRFKRDNHRLTLGQTLETSQHETL